MAKYVMGTSKRVVITPDIRERLNREVTRTGMTPRVFFKHVCDTPPTGLKPHTIENWRSGRSTHTEQHLLDFVMSAYQNSSDEAVTLKITPTRQTELEDALVLANCTPLKLVGLAGITAPKGLTPELISKWRRAKVKSAKRIQWDFVIGFCEKLAASKNR